MEFSRTALLLCSLLYTVGAQVPVLSLEPKTSRVFQGESVRFRCRVISGSQPVQLDWKRTNNQPLPDNVKIESEGSVLSIASVRSGNQGQYRCVATSPTGRSTATATLTIKRAVAAAPVASVSKEEVMAVEGQTITLQCQSTGSPTPEITWSKLRAPLPWKHAVEGGVLTLTSVGRQDSGQYICNATNTHGTSQAFTQLEVDTPPYATCLPDQLKLLPGDTLRIQCLAHGSHPITFHWSRGGGTPMPPGAKTTKDGQLLIGQVKMTDSGSYKCVATNHVGSSEALATVTVKA